MTTEVTQPHTDEHAHAPYLDTLDAAVRVIETLEPGIAANLGQLAGHAAEVQFAESVERLAGLTERLRALASTALVHEEISVEPVIPEPELIISAAELATEEPVIEATEDVADERYAFMTWLKGAITANPKLTTSSHVRFFVEAYYGQRHVARDQHEALIEKLNGLIDWGAVSRRGAFYAVDETELVYAISVIQPTKETLVTEEQGEGVAVPEPVAFVEAEEPDVEINGAHPTGLGRLAGSILGYSLENELVRVEKMRKDLPVLSEMDQEAYNDFKLEFEKLRDFTIGYLADHGITIAWDKEGQARGVKYRLIIDSENRVKLIELLTSDVDVPVPAGTLTTTVTAEPAPMVAEPQSQIGKVIVPVRAETEMEEAGPSPLDERRTIVFSGKLLRFITGQFVDGQPALRTGLAGAVMEYLPGVTKADAQHAIANYIEAGDLFKAGTTKGHLLVSPVPVEITKAKRINGNGHENGGAKDREVITSEIQTSIRQVIGLLIKAGHANKGVMQADILSGLGMDKSDLQQVLKFMTGSGIFQRKKAWERSRSPHSVKKESMFIGFGNQRLWNEFRTDPDTFMAQNFPVAE